MDPQPTGETACTDAGGTWTAGSWTPTYAVDSFFGTCKNDNAIDSGNRAGTCTNSEYKFVDDTDGNKLVLHDWNGTVASTVSDGLGTLLSCANSGAIAAMLNDGGVDNYVDPNDAEVRSNVATYIITYDLALQYTRTIHNAAFDENGNSATLDYCDDQQFTATIRRDAKASVTSAQIKAAGLNRAVVVKDLGWIGDGDETGCPSGEFQLEILLMVMDQDARGNTAWGVAQLTKAFVDTASDAQNNNLMQIYSFDGAEFGIIAETDAVGGSDTAAATGNHFKIRSNCIAITECDTSDSTQNGDSWNDLSREFVTDLVVRGTFLEADVDSKIELTVDFSECPVSGEATVDGDIRVGLQLTCLKDQATDDEKLVAKSLAQPAIDTHDRDATDYSTAADYEGALGSIDCSKAFADDVARVEGFAFATNGSTRMGSRYCRCLY